MSPAAKAKERKAPGPKVRVGSWEILDYIKSCGEIGRTNAEIARHFRLSSKEVTNRIANLSRNGQIKWNGRTRQPNESCTHRGTQIWVVE